LSRRRSTPLPYTTLFRSRLKYRLNLFEKPYYDLKDFPLFGSAEHAAAALQAAEESLVLLKNTDGILPLAKGKKLLVTGPNANSIDRKSTRLNSSHVSISY